MGLKLYLEELLGARVDLVTERAVRPEIRAQVDRDAIRVPYFMYLNDIVGCCQKVQ